jgi:Glycosyl transferase family 2
MSPVTSRVPVSACLIVRDEQQRLPECLASVSFCAEVVVVDSGSSDRTMEIAREAGAKVLEHPWAGYAAQRNFALDQASHDWVLEIDADERVSDLLREEIEAFLQDAPEQLDITAIPLRHVFLGRRLGPSALYPMYRHRLFRRARHRHDERRNVHEGLVPDGPTHAFVGDLEHRLADDWGEALGDCLSYSRLQAACLSPPSGVGAYLKGIVLRPAAKIVWRVVVFAGWRDGWQGFAHIWLTALSDSLVWLRLGAARLRRRAPCAAREGGVAGAARQGSVAGRARQEGVADAARQGGVAGGHFGRRPHRGPARVVAIADDRQAVERARAWLEQARAEGADVALIAPEKTCLERAGGAREAPVAHSPGVPPAPVAHSPGVPPAPVAHGPGAPRDLHVRPLRRLTALHVVRALEAEQQIRPIDALVGFGGAQRLLSRRSRLLRLGSRVLPETATPTQAIGRGLAARP